MPPQFFKDAHSVLNNKFTPRAFSLSISAKDGKPNGGEDLNQSAESIDDSLIAAQAASTAPSTGSSSSRFFGAYYPGGKGQKSAAKEQITENLLEDSSIDNIESFVKATISKSAGYNSGTVTVKRASSSRASTNESDDLLITDIREISVDQSMPKGYVISKAEDKGLQYEGVQSFQSAETSADLIMEALVKSQKLCSQFKERLAQANSKISLQEKELSNYKRNSEFIKESIKSFKARLSELESGSKEFKNAKKQETTLLSGVKSNLKDLHGEMETLKTESLNYKKKLEHLKQIKMSSTYEIERKNKEIQLFQQRLDETSGLLSEQKIKSSELEKNLEQCRKNYDQKITTALADHEKSQELLKGELNDLRNIMETKIGIRIENMEPLIERQKSEIDTKIDNLQEHLSKSLNLTEKTLSGETSKSITAWDKAVNNIVESNHLMKPKFEKLISDQVFINTICTQILDGYKSLIGEVRDGFGRTVEVDSVCKDILNRIDILQEDYQKIQQNLVETSKVTEMNKKIEMKYSSVKSDLDKVTKERDAFESQTQTLKKELNQLKEYGSGLRTEIERLEAAVKSKDSNLKQSDQRAQKCKTACDSKLRTQMEIHKLITEERDKLKLEMETKINELSILEKEIEKLKTLNAEKASVIKSIREENIRNKGTFKITQDPMIHLRSEKPFFGDKIDDQLKSSKRNSTLPGTQESTNDLELTTSFDQSGKTSMKKKFPERTTQIQQKRQIFMTKSSKRKKLLDDADTNTLFDDFDFDPCEQISTLPKRYTKRKKTVGA